MLKLAVHEVTTRPSKVKATASAIDTSIRSEHSAVGIYMLVVFPCEFAPTRCRISQYVLM